ncbi:P-loop containing nucleoside triphosphate hydrolase protein [Auriculariales sp. MPI-PUGE-AT-0066]|nr:P-loop containing nucleoside triphosphate hydrolase protein [Auriculariales sp. MPI-PUGE-AT-0066]
MFPVAFHRALCAQRHGGLPRATFRSRPFVAIALFDKSRHCVATRVFSLSARALNSQSPASDKPADPNATPPTKPEPERKSLLSWIKPEQNNASSLRKIVALAKPETKTLSIAVALLLVSSGVSMTVPWTVGKLIDFFSTTSQQELLFGMEPRTAGVALLALFTVGGIANATRAFMMKMAGQRIIARLREQTYASALRQEVEFVEKGEGDILSRLGTDSSIVGDSVTQNLSDGLRAIVMSAAGLGAMFYISPTLTMLMLGVIPPVSVGAVLYGRYIKKLSNSTQEAIGDMTKVAQEALSALRTVQATNAQKQEDARFSDRINVVLGLARKEALASGIFWGASGWSGNITMLVLLGYGGQLVSKGAITVGDLSSMLFYSFYVGSGLSMLTSFFTSLMRGIGAGTRVFGLLQREPLIPPPGVGIPIEPSKRGVLRYEDVSFAYPTRKETPILTNFSLDIKVGESVAIVGKSGTGKSSIQSLLLRYYDPLSGRITYDGQDIREFTVDSWRQTIGLVPQDPVLFTGTIAENIAFGLSNVTREDIEEAARQANCEFIWDMTHGFDTRIGRLSLSGGQRQRLAIARALVRKPRLLALDEATSALDAASELRVNDAVDRILSARDTTCVIVAHRLSTVARAERIVVLEEGHVTEQGTYRELVTKENSRFRELMRAQLDAASGESAMWNAAACPPTQKDLKQQIKDLPMLKAKVKELEAHALAQ